MTALCALDFKSCSGEVSDEQDKMAQAAHKVPILNNMAVCLSKQGHPQRSLTMLDQVLKIDSDNPKALSRKLTTMLELSQYDPVRVELRELKHKLRQPPASWTKEDAKMVQSVCAQADKQLCNLTVKDKEFSKNIFEKGGLYDDKPMPEPVVEPQELTEEQKFELEWREEAEYLSTLSNFHWFIYPFFKTLEVACDKVFGCKSRAMRENERRRAEL